MRRLPVHARFIALLLATSACTQQAAQVDMRGQNTYGRNTSNGYASNNYHSSPSASRNASSNYGSSSSSYQPPAVYSNVPQQTEQSASVQSIGVSDLPPPSKSNAPAPAPEKPQSQLVSAKPVQQQAEAVNKPVSKTETLKIAEAAPVVTEKPDNAPNAQANTSASSRINPWTKRPHFSDAPAKNEEAFNLRPQGKTPAKEQQMAADVKSVDLKPHPQIEQISSAVENGAEKKIATNDAPKAVSGFMWPVGSKKILSGFGPKGGGKVNDGINIASAEGEPVWAAADGEVVYSGNQIKGYGNMVLIKHPGGKTTSYAHLNRTAVDKYARVKQGDIIGYVGSTGNVNSPQLHFAIRDGKDPVDPQKYLKRDVAGL